MKGKVGERFSTPASWRDGRSTRSTREASCTVSENKKLPKRTEGARCLMMKEPNQFLVAISR